MRGMKRLFQRGDSPPSTSTMRRSHRQIFWGGLFLSNLIAMGSTFEAVRMQRFLSPPTSTQRWAVASTTTVFILTLISLALQMMPRTSSLLNGTKMELYAILLVSAFTCAAVGTATNPATGMAVNAAGGVSFGNLYYSAWATFGCCVALLISFLRTERGLDASSELKSRGRRFRLWAVLVITNLIVMGSSASSYDVKCGLRGEVVDYRPGKYCRRAAFGVSVGCIGCVASLAVVAMRVSCTKQNNGEGRPNKVIFVVECLSSVILMCLYCFAVAYITSEEGPGAPLGNLYYSTWMTFGMIFFVGLSCFEELRAADKEWYSQRSGRGDRGSVGGGVGSVGGFSNLDRRPSVDPADCEVNDIVPAPQNVPEQSVFRQAALPAGKRGSVGEISIGD